MMRNQYIRQQSVFSNTALAARALPDAEELAILEPLRGQIPDEVFTQVFEAPKTDGSGVIRDSAAHLPLFRRLRNIGFALGLPLMLWATWSHPTTSFSEFSLASAAAQTAVQVANLLMMLAYLSVVVLAMQL